ncbi:fliP [Wigglesworthia glossinidia endosymbiont of Glossina brevipalpis]|uniref:Flagellar biosynthetic protein FliP n=1 Tax=Wigglesworthia glossinidia brevipalpis TaxID=36870 RepID=Q8D3F1_WIGBR|nr:fliP [Wigglesworthia glossinidia endosymbiont of Glossina brevipalpis]
MYINIFFTFFSLTKKYFKKIFVILILILFYFPVYSVSETIPIDSQKLNSLEDIKLSLPVQTLLFLTSLTFIPALILLMSSFTRIIIVLSILRNALGTPTAPPNQILIGLSLCLTIFIMSPVLEKIYYDSYLPFYQNKINLQKAIIYAEQPIKEFMISQTREKDLAFYSKISKTNEINSPKEVPIKILIPAFVTSELKTAFQIGFTLFIPFLIIDMVVASILMALGMMMLPPTTVSLPFKLMLFVMADGWQILLGSLVQSFTIN